MLVRLVPDCPATLLKRSPEKGKKAPLPPGTILHGGYAAGKQGLAGLRSDQSILLATAKSKLAYPDRLRRVSYRDPETDKYLVFLTNRFDLPALTIAEIYRKRWMVELFFKWIKQNLSIKHFFGNSINAVKSQIWIAVCVYLIVMIARKRLNLPASPQILLNIFEVNMFEKIPIDQLVTDALLRFDDYPTDNQLNLF